MTLTKNPDQMLKQFKGFMGSLGAKLVSWGPKHATIELNVTNVHLNAMDIVHGGVIAALIDTAGAHAGILCEETGRIKKAMTISVNVNLVGNISTGRLIASARLRKSGKTIFLAACDVSDEEGNLLATGEVIGRYGKDQKVNIEKPL